MLVWYHYLVFCSWYVSNRLRVFYNIFWYFSVGTSLGKVRIFLPYCKVIPTNCVIMEPNVVPLNVSQGILYRTNGSVLWDLGPFIKGKRYICYFATYNSRKLHFIGSLSHTFALKSWSHITFYY